LIEIVLAYREKGLDWEGELLQVSLAITSCVLLSHCKQENLYKLVTRVLLTVGANLFILCHKVSFLLRDLIVVQVYQYIDLIVSSNGNKVEKTD
jgi:hypothetical protein